MKHLTAALALAIAALALTVGFAAGEATTHAEQRYERYTCTDGNYGHAVRGVHTLASLGDGCAWGRWNQPQIDSFYGGAQHTSCLADLGRQAFPGERINGVPDPYADLRWRFAFDACRFGQPYTPIRCAPEAFSADGCTTGTRRN